MMSGQQGDFNCGASSQADFILNYIPKNFLKFSSNFLKFPLKFSISSQPGWQAGTIKATLATKAFGWMVILVRHGRGFITVRESSPLYLSHCAFLAYLKQNKKCAISNFLVIYAWATIYLEGSSYSCCLFMNLLYFLASLELRWIILNFL